MCCSVCWRPWKGRLCLLETLETLEVLEVMRYVLLCMLEEVEGKFYLPELFELLEVPVDAPRTTL